MKTLKEINSERNNIIDEAVRTLYNNPRLERGVPYTAEELSDLTGGIIPAENFQNAMNAGFCEVRERGYKRYCGSIYHLYGGITCRFVEADRKLTYKVYDERGKLIDEFVRHKRLIKAEII